MKATIRLMVWVVVVLIGVVIGDPIFGLPVVLRDK